MVANLDDLSSSEDEDYVPEAKILKKTDIEISKQNGVEDKSPPKTGIDLLKERKKDREVDDMWDLMQEDDTYKNKLKVQKTDEA